MCYVMMSDGETKESEFSMIDKVAANVGLNGISESAMEEGIKSAINGDKPDFSDFSDSEKKKLLKGCAKVAFADNVLHENELAILCALGNCMGYTPEHVVEIMEQAR